MFVSAGDLSASRRVRLRGAGVGARTGQTASGGPQQLVDWSRLLSPELFRDALVRERRRADRFEQTFVVVLFSFAGAGRREWCWRHLVETLSETALDTDAIGWLEQDAVLALIRPLADEGHGHIIKAFTGKVRRELTRHLTPADLNRCSIRWEVYSPPIAKATASLDGSRPKPQPVAEDVVKRTFDVIGSAALLLALAPVFLLVAAVVKLTSKGPVLFPQRRIGAGGRPFTMMKFRTMHLNADPGIHQQYVENFIQSHETSSPEKVFKIVDDPRVTPVGHFLRRSSLDELPQFWNVLKGEMSLVGPRPPLPYEVARYKPWHLRRVLEVKPGITGPWQVSGRSHTTFDDMVRLDVRYAQSHSIWTDLKILMATPRAVISGKGAH